MADRFLPAEVTLWYCPACGRLVNGTYTLDERRSKCTKTIHRAKAMGAVYRFVKRCA